PPSTNLHASGCGRPHGVVTVSRIRGDSENKGGSGRPLGRGKVRGPARGEVAVDARSALFDLYGDHLRARDDEFRGQVPVAALVRMLAPLGVQAPAVRTAISRMVRQGWLVAVRLPEGPGYALTPRAVRRLDEAAERIYRTSAAEWDGTWHLLVISPPAGRTDRERLQAQLQFLGYGAIGGATWISPRPAPELDATLAESSARAERFTAAHDGDSQ